MIKYITSLVAFVAT